jgi:AraC-like DNA-binding protein
VHVDIEPLSNLPFECEATLHNLPSLRCVSWVSSAARFERTPRIVAKGGDTFGFVINCRGRMSALQRNRELSLGHGDAALMLHSEPAALTQMRSRGICLVFPRAALGPIFPQVEDVAARVISRRSEALQLLRCYLRFAERSGHERWPREIAGRHIADLVALVLTAGVGIGESDISAVAAARLNAVLQCIGERFRDPALTVASVAKDQGISPRYLQRLLKSVGMSFTERVNALRLEHAFALLTDPRRAKGKISDVALQAGFSDVSHFNRLFRGRFGDTPKGVRGARVEVCGGNAAVVHPFIGQAPG